MKSIKPYLFSISSIFTGGLIYICFRIESLKMFSWFKSINISKVITTIRNYALNYELLIPDWVKFSLPDGLWLFSFISLILITWKNEINSSNLLWLISLPIIALLSEIGQFISIIPGTFDWTDIAMYLIGFTSPFIIYKKTLIIKL